MSINKATCKQADLSGGRCLFFSLFYVEFWAVACTVTDGYESRALHCPNYDSTRAMHYYFFL